MTTSQLFDSSGSLLQSEPNEQDLAGVIKWLPKKPELEGRGIETSSLGIEEGAYGHPVVILSPRPENGWVQALLITSFTQSGVNSLREKFPKKRGRRVSYVPIVPAEPHPDTGVLLHLEGGRRWERKAWINRRNIKVPEMCLEGVWNPGRWVLARHSYQELIGWAGYTLASASKSPKPQSPNCSVTPSVARVLLPAEAQHNVQLGIVGYDPVYANPSRMNPAASHSQTRITHLASYDEERAQPSSRGEEYYTSSRSRPQDSARLLQDQVPKLNARCQSFLDRLASGTLGVGYFAVCFVNSALSFVVRHRSHAIWVIPFLVFYVGLFYGLKLGVERLGDLARELWDWIKGFTRNCCV